MSSLLCKSFSFVQPSRCPRFSPCPTASRCEPGAEVAGFPGLTLLIQRSVVHGRVGDVKTEYSRDSVPLDTAVVEALMPHKERSFSTPEGWLFANPITGRPYHQEEIQKKHIRKAGVAAGIGGDIGWHTFRHSYRSWLDETGAPLTVQEELNRHASIQTTKNIYGKAMRDSKCQGPQQGR